MQAATPFHAAILRDGHVSDDEYRRAVHATVGCLRRSSAGIRIHDLQPVPGGEIEYQWSVAEERPDLARRRKQALEDYETCQVRYERTVALAYSDQRVVPAEQRPAVRADLVACLRRAGLRVPSAPSMERLVAILEADMGRRATPCTNRYVDFFRVPSNAPRPG